MCAFRVLADAATRLVHRLGRAKIEAIAPIEKAVAAMELESGRSRRRPSSAFPTVDTCEGRWRDVRCDVGYV